MARLFLNAVIALCPILVLGSTCARVWAAEPPDQATVGGKYSVLIRTVRMPEDERKYGKFFDYGFWRGGRWGKHENLPAGYWVYVAPNWYVWKESKAAGLIPPRVIAVDPPEHATDVSAKRREIIVTFDRPMARGAWSWLILSPYGAYPGLRGGPPPRFDETGTKCTLAVSLAEGRVYAVGVNSPRHTGFKDANGVPALSFAWAFATGGHKPDDLPPRVVAISPQHGAIDVDPTLKEISVTFDRPMRRDTWSWVLQPKRGQYPGTRASQPRFDERGLTCTLPVSLKPGTVYALSVNSYRHTGFKSRSGKPALPFAWAFKTRR